MLSTRKTLWDDLEAAIILGLLVFALMSFGGSVALAQATNTPTPTTTKTPTSTRTPAPAVRTNTPSNCRPMLYDEPGGAFVYARGNTTNGMKTYSDDIINPYAHPFAVATDTPIAVMSYDPLDSYISTDLGRVSGMQETDEQGTPIVQLCVRMIYKSPTATFTPTGAWNTPTNTPTVTPAYQKKEPYYLVLSDFGDGAGFKNSAAVTFPYVCKSIAWCRSPATGLGGTFQVVGGIQGMEHTAPNVSANLTGSACGVTNLCYYTILFQGVAITPTPGYTPGPVTLAVQPIY